MTSDQIRQEIRSLVAKAEMVDDPRLAVKIIRQRIAELTDNGQDVPQELIRVENHYVHDCICESQGR